MFDWLEHSFFTFIIQRWIVSVKSKSNQTITNSKQLSVNENIKSKNKIIIRKNEKFPKNKSLNFLHKSAKNNTEKQIDINKNDSENFFVNNRNLICKQINLINLSNEITFLKFNVNNNTIEKNEHYEINANYIKNKLRRKPPKINHYYEQKFIFKNNNIFSSINGTLANITIKRIPNNFFNHLMIIDDYIKRNVYLCLLHNELNQKI